MFKQILARRLILPSRTIVKNYSSEKAIQDRVSKLVKENKVVLFMKGSPEQPMCGFSRAVVQILDVHGVPKKDMTTFNVLDDEDVRQGIVLANLFCISFSAK